MTIRNCRYALLTDRRESNSGLALMRIRIYDATKEWFHTA